MLFNSLDFALSFPVIILLYFLIPNKFKNIWLLICSYYFYMHWNPKYIILLVYITLVTYLGGFLIDISYKNSNTKRAKVILYTCITLCISTLVFFKYLDFLLNSFITFIRILKFDIPNHNIDILLPVGISFFIFQSMAYIIDVYRKDTYAEKDIIKYALFISFFPQLVAGPIERSKHLLTQLSKTYKPSITNLKEGMLLMLWGYILKMVLADRIAPVVDRVFNNYADHTGSIIVMATFLFAFQIYCDFSGYSIIAKGASKMIGIELMDNFDAPYLSSSVAEFWRRWHISLSLWFRDYVYIALGGSRKGNYRKYYNLMIVFLLSGLWHGARWSFIAWGMLNALYQIFGSMTNKMRSKIRTALGCKKNTISQKFVDIFITFTLVDISWLFFRANGLMNALRMLKQIGANFNFGKLVSVFNSGGGGGGCFDTKRDLWLILSGIGILVASDFFKYKHIKIRKIIMQQDWWFQYIVIFASVLYIGIFGVWGVGFDASSFIYFQF